MLFESIRRMLSEQVYDVLRATGHALAIAAPRDVGDVRQGRPLVSFSSEMAEEGVALKRFLRDNLYRHPQVAETTGRAKDVIRELFAAYQAEPPASLATEGDLPRALADYIAGMTDRFALREHERLTGRRLFD